MDLNALWVLVGDGRIIAYSENPYNFLQELRWWNLDMWTHAWDKLKHNNPAFAGRNGITTPNNQEFEADYWEIIPIRYRNKFKRNSKAFRI